MWDAGNNPASLSREQIMNTEIKVLVYFPKQSRHAPARNGEFVATEAMPDSYIYQGRLLTMAEFNALPGEVFEQDRYSARVRVRLVPEMVQEQQSEDPEDEPEAPALTVDWAEDELSRACVKADVAAIGARLGIDFDDDTTRIEMEAEIRQFFEPVPQPEEVEEQEPES